MTYKSLASVVRSGLRSESKSQYKSLNNAIRSIYNHEKKEDPSEEDLAMIQNRKAQVKSKIIDNA